MTNRSLTLPLARQEEWTGPYCMNYCLHLCPPEKNHGKAAMWDRTVPCQNDLQFTPEYSNRETCRKCLLRRVWPLRYVSGAQAQA
jgi:hypothetical protein